MKRIAFYVNREKPRAERTRNELASVAAALGLVETAPSGAEVLVALGGDGTILRAVREWPDLPVLGLNLGSLGYLASVEERDFAAALKALADGRYALSRRSVLEARVGASASMRTARALNDVVIVREMSGHAAVLDLAVDGHAAARYLADGLVVATPTGSTAYSLSAGGPVLMPDSASFVVTPMNPHALGIRPMVTRDTARFSITCRSREGAAAAERLGVYVDGMAFATLGADETLVVEKSAREALLVELEGYDPYGVMSRKLGWRGTCIG